MPHRARVERLFDAFNRRDTAEIVAVCSEEMGFYPYATAEAVGRGAPYSGTDGLNEYMADIMATNPDKSAVVTDLVQVFHMD